MNTFNYEYIDDCGVRYSLDRKKWFNTPKYVESYNIPEGEHTNFESLLMEEFHQYIMEG